MQSYFYQAQITVAWQKPSKPQEMLPLLNLVATGTVAPILFACAQAQLDQLATALKELFENGLDPYDDPQGWLDSARNLQQPLTVVIADQSPPKSLVQMQALAAVADRVAHLPGRLGAHEEFGAELADLVLGG